jgi:hypothetical protein
MKNLMKKLKGEGWKGKILITMAATLYIYVTFLLFWPYTPITINSIEIVNKDGIVTTGEDLIYEVNLTKTHTYPCLAVTRQLIDGFVLTLAPIKGSNMPLGTYSKQIPVNISENAAPGTYYLHWSATYQVNHLRTITVSFDSPKFEIVNPQS